MANQDEEGYAETNSRDARGFSWLVPGKPLWYALAALSVLIVGVGIYAASTLVRDLSLPGSPAPSAADTGATTDPGQAGGSAVVQDLFQSYAPGVGGEQLRETKTADGARVTLIRAYADADSVVVGYTVEDLEGGRRVGKYPAELQPSYFDGIRLTDESGTEFRLADGGGEVSPGPNKIQEGPRANVAVFETEERVESGRAHRFRLEIPILEVAVTPSGSGGGAPEPQAVGEPLVVGFETPVRTAPVVEVDQTATAGGITLTMKQVTDSPGQPEAEVCMEPQDGVRGWFPIGEDLASEAPVPVTGKGNCLRIPLSRSLDGPSSVTVNQIEINPFCSSCSNEEKMVSGPWRFDFEMPDS